jgi:ATP phosphoribosyltransferase regulatory subunit
MHRQDRSLIPAGMTTILPRTAERVRRLEEIVLGRLGRWGYREIIPPAFEYLDVLSAGLEPELIEKCYKFADPTTGRILLLRPDVTAQIARIVAMGIVDSELPLRLCYRTTVFRHEPEHAGREREIFQVGAELIGVDDVIMDAEIIALMIEALKQAGLPVFTISLGHVGFFKALLAKSGLSPDGQKRAEQAAARKDLPRLEEILSQERIAKSKAAAVLETPGLYGREEVLERGRSLAGQDRELRAALERLSQVYRLLVTTGAEAHLLLDLGEFRGFDYYDGVVFDVFAEGVGYELGGGGRYNHLIGRFGRELPSTGFAFDMDRLFRAIDKGNGLSKTGTGVLLSAPAARGGQLFEVARLLREAGFRVLQGRPRPAGRQAVPSTVQEGQAQGAAAAVILGAPGVSEEEALLIADLARSAGTKVVKIKELPTSLRRH